MSLRILRLAAGSSFQDFGRPGFRRYGVAPGGAFDRESYRLAMALVGRSEGVAVEIPIPGADFEVMEADRLALVGAVCAVSRNEEPVPSQATFPVAAGDRLKIGPADQGVRVYLASARGWSVGKRLGSASGIVPSSELTADLSSVTSNQGRARLASVPESLTSHQLRILPGPQAGLEDLNELVHRTFRVSLNSNRMGVRLEGGGFRVRGERPSEASVAGAVQLAPSGELLVHGPDGPTIGGYPKIAVVIDADLDRLAQLRPTSEVQLEVVDPHSAKELGQEREARIEKVVRDLRISRGIEG